MTIRVFLSITFVFISVFYSSSSWASDCENSAAAEADLQGEDYSLYNWKCETPDTELVDTSDSLRFVANVPIPAHNGQKDLRFTGLEPCPIAFVDFNASDGVVIGSYPNLVRFPTGGKGYARFDIKDSFDPFSGYVHKACPKIPLPHTTTAIENARKACIVTGSYFVGTLKNLSSTFGCPGSPIRPETPPEVSINVESVEEFDDFYRVKFNKEVDITRYWIDFLEYEFGDGEILEISWSDINSRKDPEHDYAKPISSAKATFRATDVSGRSASEIIDVFFTDPEKPIAAFSSDILGRRLELTNTSEHPKSQSMTYQWEMGDGTRLTEESPVHVYEEAGTYFVTLTVTDVDGDMDMADETIAAKNGVFIDIDLTNDIIDVNDEVSAKVSAYNYESSDIDNFTIETPVDTNFVTVTSGPSPAVLRYIPKDGSMSTNYLLKGKMSGDTEMVAIGKGKLEDGMAVEVEKREPLYIQPDLDIELSTSATSETRAGEEVTITLTITNSDNETITGIKLDALMVEPHNLLTFVSGPLDPNGNNPRVNAISLAAGTSTTVTWTYIAEERGVTNLRAFLTADRVRGNGSITQDDSTVLAIESAAFELSQLRVVGGTLQSPTVARPVPGTFNFVRGIITNVGGVDITGIDVKIISSEPGIAKLDALVDRLGSDITPKIAILKPGKANSREFVIPISMVTDVGLHTRFVLPVEFTGKAEIDGEEVDVKTRQEIRGNIDRDEYYTAFIPELLSLYLNDFISLIDTVDDFGDTTLGARPVGATEGVLKSLQKMGDSLLQIDDLIIGAGTIAGNIYDEGAEGLVDDALVILKAMREYRETHSTKEMATDLSEVSEDITVAGVRIVADYMRSVDVAYDKKDYRKVARLLSEPATDVGIGLGAEKAAAGLLTKLYERIPLPTRKTLRGYEKKGKDITDDTPDAEVVEIYRKRKDSWEEIPSGVRLPDGTARLAGLAGDQLEYLTRKAQEYGITFYVRPRPATATKWAARRLNAKPMDIKTKSLNDTDSKWLGYGKDNEGLVSFGEPEDPSDAMLKAIIDGELAIGDPQILKIEAQYQKRKAQFLSKDSALEELNSKNGGMGIKYLQDGETKFSKVNLDSDGFLIFDNGRRVYSDIDLMGITRAVDGSNLGINRHVDILKELEFGIDLQHGAVAQSSDFSSFNQFLKVGPEQFNQHLPGGEGGGLIIIGPNGISKGHVNSWNIPRTDLFGSNADLFGAAKLTYTGGI